MVDGSSYAGYTSNAGREVKCSRHKTADTCVDVNAKETGFNIKSKLNKDLKTTCNGHLHVASSLALVKTPNFYIICPTAFLILCQTLTSKIVKKTSLKIPSCVFVNHRESIISIGRFQYKNMLEANFSPFIHRLFLIFSRFIAQKKLSKKF